MKLLSIGTALPPFNVGGFEVGALRACEELERSFGFEVHYLTSFLGVSEGLPITEKRRYRVLPIPGTEIKGGQYPAYKDPARSEEQRAAALAVMKEVVRSVHPDVVMFWQVFAAYSLRIVPWVEAQGIPAFLYQSNVELSPYETTSPVMLWRQKGRFRKGDWRAYGGLLRSGRWRDCAVLNWNRVAFCSQWLKNVHQRMGIPVERSPVIRWGIDAPKTMSRPESRTGSEALRILWAGRIVPEKGLHVLIQAIQEISSIQITLDVFGPDRFPGAEGYSAEVKAEVERLHLASCVRFRGVVTPDALREMMVQYDVFCLTSTWEEPFSVGFLEAAAAGLVLIGTATGGTSEFLSAANGFLVPPNDSHALSVVIKRLCEDWDLVRKMKARAQQSVNDFGLSKMAADLATWMSAGRT